MVVVPATYEMLLFLPSNSTISFLLLVLLINNRYGKFFHFHSVHCLPP